VAAGGEVSALVVGRDEDGFRSLPEPGTGARIWFLTIEHITIQRMGHLGIVVDDLAGRD
jgi:hypothetical protein